MSIRTPKAAVVENENAAALARVTARSASFRNTKKSANVAPERDRNPTNVTHMPLFP